MYSYSNSISSPTSSASPVLSIVALILSVLAIVVVAVLAFRRSQSSSSTDDGQSQPSDLRVTPASVESWWIDGGRHRRYLRSLQTETVNGSRDGAYLASSVARNDYDDWNLFVYAKHEQLSLSTALETARNAMRGRRSDLVAFGGLKPPSKTDEQQVADEDPADRWKHVYWNEMSQQRRVAYQQGYWEVRRKTVYNGLDMSFAKLTANGVCYEVVPKVPELQCSMYVRECARLSDGKPMLFVQFEQELYPPGLYDTGYEQLIGMLTRLVAVYPLRSWPMIIVGGFGVHGADRVLDDLLNGKGGAAADSDDYDGSGYHVPLFYRWPTYNGSYGVFATDAFAVSKALYERVEYFVEFAENWESPWSRIGARCFPRVDEQLAGTYDVTGYEYRLYADAVAKNADELKRETLVGIKPSYDPSKHTFVDTTISRLDNKYSAQ